MTLTNEHFYNGELANLYETPELEADATAARIWGITKELEFNPDFYRAVVRTPLVELSPDALPEDLRESGYRVLVKNEGAQRTGAYKIRGAMSKLLANPDSVRVVAASTGNFATAVAYGASVLGIEQADIMTVRDISPAKDENITSFGGTVHADYDHLQDAMTAARKAGSEPGSLFLHPYDDDYVIAGSGTIVGELEEQLAELGLSHAHTTAHISTGGGGQATGIAVAMSQVMPETAMYAHQPEGAAAIVAALNGEELAYFNHNCDGAAVDRPGERALQILGDRRYAKEVNSITDGRIGEGMAILSHLGRVPEPAGALGFAGALQYMREHPIDPSDPTPHVVVAVLSGTVVTPQKVREFMSAAYNEGCLDGPTAQRVYGQAYRERSISGVSEVVARTAGDAALFGWPAPLGGPTSWSSERLRNA